MFDIQTDTAKMLNVDDDNPGYLLIGQNGTLKKSMSPNNMATEIQLETELIEGGKLELLGHRLNFSEKAVNVTDGIVDLGGGRLIVAIGLYISFDGIVTGVGAIEGDVYNDGQILVGGVSTIGVITIEGDYHHNDFGRLVIEISGTQQNQFDRLVVTGEAYSSGTVQVILVNYNPVQGDSFKVVEATDGFTGGFAIDAPLLGGGLEWDDESNANDFTLKVV